MHYSNTILPLTVLGLKWSIKAVLAEIAEIALVQLMAQSGTDKGRGCGIRVRQTVRFLMSGELIFFPFVSVHFHAGLSYSCSLGVLNFC